MWHIAHDFGNNFAAFFHIEVVALVDIELADDIFVVKRSALHDGAGKEHRFQVCHRSDNAGAAHFETDESERRTFAVAVYYRS